MRPQLRFCLAAKPALRRGPLFMKRRPARSAQTAQTRPASLNDQVTAMRGRQRSRRPVPAPATLPAVRPTAAPCGRGARPLLRPGSWGRMAAPYNEATLKSSQYAQVFVDAVGFTYEETALRPQLRLCLAAKPALLPRPLFTIRWPARSAQTAQTKPASLNDQVTAMRGRQSSLAPRMRRQHWRPFAPPPRPTVAAPGRCCGPVRGAAWPHLITTLAAGRSLDSPGVTAQLPRLLYKVDRGLTRVSANLPLPASGNTPGNPPSADRATRAVPLRPAHRAPPCLAAAAQQGVVPSPAA